MSEAFDYTEAACTRCGHFNRRFGKLFLDGRHPERCDFCGAELATGKFSLSGGLDRAVTILAVDVLCGGLGAGIAMVAASILAWMALGSRFDAVRTGVFWVGGIAGALAGVAYAERSRRRSGFTGPKRLAPDLADPAPAGAAQPSRAEGVETRGAVRAKAARNTFLALGFGAGWLGTAAIGEYAARAFGNAGWITAAMLLVLPACTAAGWIWGRWKYPLPPRGSDGS